MNKKKNNDPSVQFLYGTVVGRLILKCMMKMRVDRLIVHFLWSPISKVIIKGYAKKHGIPLSSDEYQKYGSFRDFFARSKDDFVIDLAPDQLISPCDGWLSAFPIDEDSTFAIKGSQYKLTDLLGDDTIASFYHGGDCLIFRLCANDYHHYCYIDDGYKGESAFIPGMLHSVQPIACDTVPVFVLNRRYWTMLITKHFGKVIQTEIGAFVVGGIVNEQKNSTFSKGMEKGHFELAGSTIVLLFQKGKMQLHEEIVQSLTQNEEVRVYYGKSIGAVGGICEKD